MKILHDEDTELIKEELTNIQIKADFISMNANSLIAHNTRDIYSSIYKIRKCLNINEGV